MGFFDDAPGAVWGRRGSGWEPPVAEFPSAVATSPLVLARTEAVAIAVMGIWAFRTGFEFWVSARFRHTQPPASGDLAPQETARLGVQFADGRKVADVDSPSPAADIDGEPAGLVLRARGFGGGRLHRDWSYWVWPLPPPGTVTFAAEWAAAGIPESRACIDAKLILDAAAGSVRLWQDPQNPPS